MGKTAVVYWSGTGNTEAMAQAVKSGASEADSGSALIPCGEFDSTMLEYYDAFAFGCPAMGGEALEESEFAPMFEAVLPKLRGRRAALFGSYGWGDGEWMRSWEDSCRAAGVELACRSVIACDAPDQDALNACRDLGKTLAQG